MHIKVMHNPGFFVVYSRMCIGFEDAPRPDSAGLSVAAGRNSKACGNLLKTFVEIHNSLRSDNGFPLITQISASQEFLPRLHMTPDWNRDGVLVYDSNPLRDCGKSDIRNPLRYLLMNAVASRSAFKSYHFKDQDLLAFIVPFK